jgi:ankyrin repeat protein
MLALIRAGADVNATDRAGRSALIFAVIDGNLDMVEFLLSQGAQINIEDEDNKSPLDYARQYQHEDIEQFLIDHGALEY